MDVTWLVYDIGLIIFFTRFIIFHQVDKIFHFHVFKTKFLYSYSFKKQTIVEIKISLFL